VILTVILWIFAVIGFWLSCAILNVILLMFCFGFRYCHTSEDPLITLGYFVLGPIGTLILLTELVKIGVKWLFKD